MSGRERSELAESTFPCALKVDMENSVLKKLERFHFIETSGARFAGEGLKQGFSDRMNFS